MRVSKRSNSAILPLRTTREDYQCGVNTPMPGDHGQGAHSEGKKEKRRTGRIIEILKDGLLSNIAALLVPLTPIMDGGQQVDGGLVTE